MSAIAHPTTDWYSVNHGPDALGYIGQWIEVKDVQGTLRGILELEDWNEDTPMLYVVHSEGQECFYLFDEWRLL